MKKTVSVLLSLAMLLCSYPLVSAAAEHDIVLTDTDGVTTDVITQGFSHDVHGEACIHEEITIDDAGVQKAVDQAIVEGNYELTEWVNGNVGKAFYAFTPPIFVDEYVTESADYSADSAAPCCDWPQIYQRLVSQLHTFDIETGICYGITKSYIVMCMGCGHIHDSYERTSPGCARIHIY